jgi:hypothetical protein
MGHTFEKKIIGKNIETLKSLIMYNYKLFKMISIINNWQ